MFRAALRTLLAHRARLVMTVLAVWLGVAFVVGTLVFAGTVTGAYTASSRTSFDHLDLRIRPVVGFGEAGSGRLLDQALLDRAGTVGAATGVVEGFAALAGPDGTLVGQGWQTRGTNVAGPVTDGRAPRRAGEVALDHRTAGRTGYRVGDTVRMSVSGPVLAQTVTGIFTTDDGNVAAGGTLTLFDTATAQTLFGKPGHYSWIDVAGVTDPERVRALLPHGTEVRTAAELADEQAAANAGSVRALSQTLLGCAGVALFVAAFLIVNTFTMLVAQRTRELALLRAVGASRRQVTLSVLTEAVLVGLVAATAGLATGVGLAAVARAVLPEPDGPLVVGAGTVVAAYAVGVGVTVLATWLPAHRAARIPPVVAMAGTTPTVRGLVVRNAVGGVLAATGAALVVAGTTTADGKVWLGVGAALLLVGVFVLTPLLSRPVIGAAGPLLRRFGVPGELAVRNALRNPRRTATTASALTVGLTLITTLTVIGASAYRTTRAVAEANLRADYQITMANAGPLAADTEKIISGLPQVVASSPRREVQASVDGVNQTVVGLKAEDVDRLLDLGFIAGTFTTGGTAIVDEPTASANGWRIGDRVPVTWPDGVREELEITGLYDSAFDDGLKVDVSVMDPHLDRVADTTVFVKTTNADDATKLALRKALGDSPAILVQDRDDLVAGITGTVGVVLNLLYGMLALAVVVAVLGVVNTLAMSVHERASEIGVLRAIGLDRSAVRRMVRLEAVVISLFGGVLGVGLGVFFGWAVGELVTVIGISTWTLVLPWTRLTLTLAAAALVGVVAAFWPARRAARLEILDAIRTE